MLLPTASATLAFSLLLQGLNAQSLASGYTDYKISVSDASGEDTIYETASTDTSDGNANFPPPDVFLNASVSVGELDILVQSLSAKINLDAQVLSLLQFNAGVDVEIGRVKLQIQNVTAKVELEARLANLVSMINDTLNSIDLNPVLATLGGAVGNISSDVGSVLGGTKTATATATQSSQASKRDSQFSLQEGILYSLNDYSGNTHTNRILEQNGDVVDQSLDNDGNVTGKQIVGTYQTLMSIWGPPKEDVTVNGQATTQQGYVYIPSHLGSFGLEVLCYIFTNGEGDVVSTRVIAEIEGGGYSTVSDEVSDNETKE